MAEFARIVNNPGRRVAGALLTLTLVATAAMTSGATASAAATASGSGGIASASCVRTGAGQVAADNHAARALAVRCHTRVEALSGRTDEAQVFAEPSGLMTLEETAVPVRVRRADGSWAAIDTRLVRGADGTYTPAATVTAVRFSGGGTVPLVTVLSGRSRWTLSWPASLPAPSVNGEEATYANVLPDVDLVVRATADGFTHVLVVKTAKAAANPALRAIRYHTSGTRLVAAAAALMWDSRMSADDLASSAAEPGTAAKRVEMAVRTSGHNLTITPNRRMLADRHTVYPVYLDPPFTANDTRWSYADNHNINNSDGRAWVGQDPINLDVYRTFYDFTVASIPYTHIISASLEAELYHSYSCTDSPVYLYSSGSVTATPRSTWAGMPLHSLLDTESAHAHKGNTSCGVQPDVVMWFNGGLTGDVQAAVNHHWTLYSLGFCACSSAGSGSALGAGETTTSRWKKFLPDTVKLHITYNSYPDAPSSLSTDPSAPCVTGAGRPVISTWTPQLKATLTDPDAGAVLQGDFYYSTNGGASWVLLPPTGGQASGLTHVVPMPDLSATAPAYISWFVQASDGTDFGGYSATCEFTVDTTPPVDPVLNFGTALPAFPSPPPSGVVVGNALSVPIGPSTDTDIAGYWYAVDVAQDSPPRTTFVPAAADGSATLSVIPVVSGFSANWLTVQAVDAAGNFSEEVTYLFRANPAS